VRPKADSALIERALRALAEALASTGAPWMVIGGIAVIARGVQRMTTDIDAVVQGDAVRLEALFDALAGSAIVPRQSNAKSFAEANLVLLVRHLPTEVDLDVSIAWTPFEREALAAATATPFGAVSAPMARVEDLIVYKAMAARSRDIDDIVALLTLHPNVDLARARRRIEQLAELAEAPELVTNFDAIVRSSAQQRGAKPSSAKPRARKVVKKPKRR
jgi:hypothetical protein